MRICRAGCRYLKDEHEQRKKTPMDWTGWEVIPCQPGTPQQNNGCDCGAFSTCFAYLLSENLPLAVR